MPPVFAEYFDGRTAHPHKVQLSLTDAGLRIEGEGVLREEPFSGIRVSEPMGTAPRLIKFGDGAHCEARDDAALRALLGAGGYADGVVVRLQQRWRWALAAVVIAVITMLSGYRWGLPAASSWLAFKLPEQALAQLGESTLKFLDKGMLAPSALPADRQNALRSAFGAMTLPDEVRARHVIVFRDGKQLGPNALALPDGTIVLTDQLVRLAGNDQEILAVLAHELGHLRHRHSLRMLIQGSIVSGVVAWYLGDVSNVAAGLPAFLLQARYSRDFEREADAYAAGLLKENDISPSRLADLLSRLEKSARPQRKPGEAEENLDGYLSTHPATRERIETIEKL